jgi:DNA-binding response OmpR family regulator
MLNDFEVVLAKNGMEGFEKFKKDTYDLCILCNDAKDTL